MAWHTYRRQVQTYLYCTKHVRVMRARLVSLPGRCRTEIRSLITNCVVTASSIIPSAVIPRFRRLIHRSGGSTGNARGRATPDETLPPAPPIQTRHKVCITMARTCRAPTYIACHHTGPSHRKLEPLLIHRQLID